MQLHVCVCVCVSKPTVMYSLSQTQTANMGLTLKYSAKVFHPQHVGGNSVVEWTSKEFKTLSFMCETLTIDLRQHVTNEEFLLGYF